MGERSELTRENIEKSKEGGVFGLGWLSKFRNYKTRKGGWGVDSMGSLGFVFGMG
jgi:hypothetical protein